MKRARRPRPEWHWHGASATPPLLRQFAQERHSLPGLLFQEAGAGMLAVNADGQIVCANATLAQMLASGVDLSPGGPAAQVFAAGLREAAWDEVFHALEGGPARPAFATRLHDPARGREATVQVEAVALPGGCLLRLADTTTQRQLEAQLAHAQKIQAVGQLAAGIAHDFNNLLTAVLGAADEIAARTSNAESAEDAAQIRAAAERGAGLVRQLLAFGRQQDLQPQVLDVNVALTVLSGLLRRLLGGGVRLELVLEAADCRVMVDPTQLDQVLVNLAVNARDAMSGRGMLALHSAQTRLQRPLLREGETIPPGRYVMIEVRDTGCGMAPELLPRIFDPFFTTKRELGGSGLGLSTVHGIVRQSNGFISVESTLGVGTQFRIYLPRWEGTEAAAVARPSTAAPPVAGAATELDVVLLVEDEDSVRRLAERALGRQGWRIVAADCAEAALEALGEHAGATRLRAIVTDLAMPGMDGLALIHAVRQRLDRPGLPAILVSGYADPALREALQQDSAIQFLAKPYSLAALLQAVAGC